MKTTARDFIPISVIIAVTIIWLSSSPWGNPESVAMAKDIALAGISGIVGYMVRTVVGAYESAELLAENQRLRQQSYSPTQSAEYIEGP
jgi:hypothetical protein